MYLCGGRHWTGSWTGVELWKYDLHTQQIIKLNSMREPRNFCCLQTINRRLYAMGGMGLLNGVNMELWLNSMEIYDIEENQWSPAPAMNNRRADAAVTVCRGKIYILGGRDEVGITDSIEVYYPILNKWRCLKSQLTFKRSRARAVCIEDKIYVVGGWDGSRRLRTCEVYCVKSRQWSTLPDMFVPRSNHCLEVLNGNLFAIGGYDHMGHTTAHVECFNIHSCVWTLVGTLPTSRSSLSSAVVPAAAVQEQLRRHLECKEQFVDRRSTALRLETARASRNNQLRAYYANDTSLILDSGKFDCFKFLY